jgi:hypothetical protein
MATRKSPMRAVLTIEVLDARCLPSNLGGGSLHHVHEAHHGHHGRHGVRIEVHHHGEPGHGGETETETETHHGKDG